MSPETVKTLLNIFSVWVFLVSLTIVSFQNQRQCQRYLLALLKGGLAGLATSQVAVAIFLSSLTAHGIAGASRAHIVLLQAYCALWMMPIGAWVGHELLEHRIRHERRRATRVVQEEIQTPQLPDVLIFRPNKTPWLMSMAGVIVVTIVVVLGLRYGGEPSFMPELLLLYNLVLGLTLIRPVFAHFPREVLLDASGIYITLRDGTIKAQSWNEPAAERRKSLSPMYLWEKQERWLYTQMVAQYVFEKAQREDAEQLLAGDRTDMGANWNDFLGVIAAVLIATLGLAGCIAFAIIVCRRPIMPVQLILSICAILPTPVLIWKMHRYPGRRISTTLQFLPDGIRRSWSWGEQFIPYSSIHEVLYEHDGYLPRSLTIIVGKQRIHLGNRPGLLFLLRERASAAIWEEFESEL